MNFNKWWEKQDYSNPIIKSFAEEAWEVAQAECARRILDKIPHNKGLNHRLVNQLRNEIQKEFLDEN